MVLILGVSNAWAQHYDRGYENVPSTVFVPKGTFMFGGNVKYSRSSMKDFSVLVINDINARGNTVSASPMFLYMLKDNIGIGGRFSYNRNMFDLESANLSVSEIASEHEISRQAASDLIKRINKLLASYEEKLKLVERFERIRHKIEKNTHLSLDEKQDLLKEL